MADPRTADARLRRILHILPAAAREGGAALDELARELDVEPATVLRDLEEVTARSFYLPAGAADDLQIHLTEDRVRVWTKGELTRPVKLLPREALALGLGMRALGSAPDDALRRRLERHLATADTDAFQPLIDPGAEGGGRSAQGPSPPPEAEIQGRLFAAAREGRPCRIRYLKPGAEEAEARALHPYTIARAEGRWYAVGRDPGADGVRIFRLDRVLDAELDEGSFQVPEGFDVAKYVRRGGLFRADEAVEVVVRYSPRIARWIREKPWARVEGEGGPGAGPAATARERADGSLVVRHRVADPRWLLGHVLRYGPDAEVLEPERLRERVRRRVEALIA